MRRFVQILFMWLAHIAATAGDYLPRMTSTCIKDTPWSRRNVGEALIGWIESIKVRNTTILATP
jgi:hypothetical protein